MYLKKMLRQNGGQRGGRTWESQAWVSNGSTCSGVLVLAGPMKIQ